MKRLVLTAIPFLVIAGSAWGWDEYNVNGWICRTPDRIRTGQVTPVGKTGCYKTPGAYGLIEKPEDLGDGIVKFHVPFNGYDGPWYAKRSSIEHIVHE